MVDLIFPFIMSHSTGVGLGDTDGSESERTQKAAATGQSVMVESSIIATNKPDLESSPRSASEGVGTMGYDGTSQHQPNTLAEDTAQFGVAPEPTSAKPAISSTKPPLSVVSNSSTTVAAGSVPRKDTAQSSRESLMTNTDVAAGMTSVVEAQSNVVAVGGTPRKGSTVPQMKKPSHGRTNSASTSAVNTNGLGSQSAAGSETPIEAIEAVPSRSDSVPSAGISAPSSVSLSAPTRSDSGATQRSLHSANSSSFPAAVTSETNEVSSVEPTSSSVGPSGSNVPSLTGPSVAPDMVSLGSATSNFESSTIATAGTMNADFRFQQLPPLPPAPTGPQLQQSHVQQQGLPQNQVHISVGQQVLRPSATNEDSASGSQQTVPQAGSFEIPGVVTLTAVENLDESSIQNTSLSQLPQPAPEQVVDTIGAVPIVKIQGEAMFVRKKKGRFNILQDIPAVRKPGSSGGSGSLPSYAVQIGGGSIPQGVPSGSNAGSPSSSSQGQQVIQPEHASVASNTNSSATTLAAMALQSRSPGTSLTGSMVQSSQAGDTSPVVKKMGRFVVTKVDGAGSNPIPPITQAGQSLPPDTANLPQVQGPPPASNIGEDEQIQQVPPLQGQPQLLQEGIQQMQRQQQELQQLQQMQELQKLRQIQHQQQELQHRHQTQQQEEEIMRLHQIHQQQLQELHQLQQIQQQEFHKQQLERLPHQQNSQHPQHLQVDPQPRGGEQLHIPPSNQPPQSNVEVRPANRAQATYVVKQHIPIPATTVTYPIQQQAYSPWGSKEIPAEGHLPGVSSTLQIPQPPPQPSVDTGPAAAQVGNSTGRVGQQTTHPETSAGSGPAPGGSGASQAGLPPRSLQAHPSEILKTETANRNRAAGRVPQTFDNKGGMSSVGLGKVFYFLDQMKLEVTDADRTIKNLQTDMKILVSPQPNSRACTDNVN